ncbi:HI0074 family nucleotidyltransferase substrate-binding subunit [Oscillospiraceae bacterium 42-9]
MKKFENFCKALDNLRLVRDLNEPYDVLTLTGSAALFEICLEQAWKAMKEILQEHGYGEAQTGSPKQILKLAYSAGMIQDEGKWLAMLVSRNDVTHSYNEEIALALIKRVKEAYIDLLEELKTEIETQWG